MSKAIQEPSEIMNSSSKQPASKEALPKDTERKSLRIKLECFIGGAEKRNTPQDERRAHVQKRSERSNRTTKYVLNDDESVT